MTFDSGDIYWLPPNGVEVCPKGVISAGLLNGIQDWLAESCGIEEAGDMYAFPTGVEG